MALAPREHTTKRSGPEPTLSPVKKVAVDDRTDTTAAMAATRRADSAQRRERVLDALRHVAVNGGAVSVTGIARIARVHRTFIYRHKDLLDRVRSMESEMADDGRR